MTALLVALLSIPALADAWCYPSGLRVSLEGRAGRKDIGIASVVGGGAAAQLESEIGAAHVVEHLSTSPIPTRPAPGSWRATRPECSMPVSATSAP